MASDFSTTRMHNKHFIKLFTSGHEVAKQMKMKLQYCLLPWIYLLLDKLYQTLCQVMFT